MNGTVSPLKLKFVMSIPKPHLVGYQRGQKQKLWDFFKTVAFVLLWGINITTKVVRERTLQLYCKKTNLFCLQLVLYSNMSEG